MIVKINGKDNELSAGSTVGDFLRQKGISADSVVVEINGTIVEQQEYSERVVKDKDIIEILRFVGGG